METEPQHPKVVLEPKLTAETGSSRRAASELKIRGSYPKKMIIKSSLAIREATKQYTVYAKDSTD